MKSDDPNMDNKTNDVAVKVESSTPIENKEIEVKQGKQSSDSTVKKTMKEEKSRKKDDKSVEQVLKALNSLETTEEKLAAMCKKYADIVDENRKLQLTAKQTEKRLTVVQHEKEQLRTEHSKAVLTRSRLESLCRELQRQNKAIKDESLLKIREEEEKRKEVSAKFQSTLNEITALMQQNNEKNSKLREDNLEMTKKFKTVCEQYELREQQVEKITKQMQLEAQLSDAKLAKAKMEMAAEKEAMLKEKQQLLLDLTEYQTKCQELQTTEINLRSQISLYTDKYDEFQNALSRSNEVFGGFKGEMEKMSKKICKLEKETSSWKQRWEKSHQALLEMAADKQQRDSELALATRQLAQLQKLCRTLQGERTSLLAQLKSEEAGKIGDTINKEDVPPESLSKSQHAVIDTSECSSNPSGNVELCDHEVERKVLEELPVLQTQTEEPKICQGGEIEIVEQNQEGLSIAESTFTELNVNQQNPTKDLESSTLNEEHIVSPVSEEINSLTEVSTKATNEENSVEELTVSCSTEMAGSIPTVSEELIGNQSEVVISASNVHDHSENIDSQISQNEKECDTSVVSVSATEQQTSVTENNPRLTEMSKESFTLPPENENKSVCEIQNNNQECSQDSIINGQIPALIINPTDVANVSLDTKDIPMTNENTTSNTNHIIGNGVIDQLPVKGTGAETKKGKEGAKKRKNK